MCGYVGDVLIIPPYKSDTIWITLFLQQVKIHKLSSFKTKFANIGLNILTYSIPRGYTRTY